MLQLLSLSLLLLLPSAPVLSAPTQHSHSHDSTLTIPITRRAHPADRNITHYASVADNLRNKYHVSPAPGANQKRAGTSEGFAVGNQVSGSLQHLWRP